MSIDIGIIGLPKSGRTTVFNALTKGTVDTASYRREMLAPHIGVAKVPDPRLVALTEMFHPKKTTPAEVRYLDISASLKDLAKDKGIGGELLNQLSTVDALINVARAFADDSVPHPSGSLDIGRDIDSMNMELAFSDLVLLERRLERIATSLKGAPASERQALIREQELMARIKEGLEKEMPVREMMFSPEETKLLNNYQLLTSKPLLIIVNIGEEGLAGAAALETELKARFARPKCNLVSLCGRLEMEIAELDDAAAKDMLASFNIKESGLERAIKFSYDLLGLVTFLTVGEDEVKAWPIKSGTIALKAAGKIHSDIERGFIKAEIVSYDDLIKCGSLAEARRKGLLRLEGKNYLIKDGDITNFLFNV
jgi:ribosome-binding ATPase